MENLTVNAKYDLIINACDAKDANLCSLDSTPLRVCTLPGSMSLFTESTLVEVSSAMHEEILHIPCGFFQFPRT